MNDIQIHEPSFNYQRITDQLNQWALWRLVDKHQAVADTFRYEVLGPILNDGVWGYTFFLMTKGPVDNENIVVNAFNAFINRYDVTKELLEEAVDESAEAIAKKLAERREVASQE